MNTLIARGQPILVVLAFSVALSGTAAAQSFRFPIDNWQETCDFDVTCWSPNHLGDDGTPAVGLVVNAVVKSPAAGFVKEARKSRGYGGIVVIEAASDLGPLTIILGHMRHGEGDILVKVGDEVFPGTPLGKIAPKGENGGNYDPHVHIGIHLGSYRSYNLDCITDKESVEEWVYAGYTKCRSDVILQWLDPSDFIAARMGDDPPSLPSPHIDTVDTEPAWPIAGHPFTFTVHAHLSNIDAATVQVVFNGPNCSPCTVPRSALTVNLPTIIGPATLNEPGTYNLSIRNGDSGPVSNAWPISVMAPSYARPTPSLFYERAGQSNTSFGVPVVDSQGNVLAVRSIFGTSCGFGLCEMRLDSIGPDGVLNWETPRLDGGDSIASRALFLGATDRAHVLGHSIVSGIERDGAPAIGWPVQLVPVHNWNFTGIAVDPTDATVISSLGVFGACAQFCDKTIVATRVDGSEKWRHDFPGDGTAYGIALGPNRRVFTLTGIVGFPPSATLIGLDPDTGAEVCRTKALSEYGSLRGSADGVFVALGGVVTRFDADCRATVIFDGSPATEALRGIVGRRLISLETRSNVPLRIASMDVDGGSVWRNSEVIVTTDFPVLTSFGSYVYVIGQDATDGNRQKIFEVDSASGSIRRRIATEGTCTNCGAAVAPDGTLYINDLDSTKIYRIDP